MTNRKVESRDIYKVNIKLVSPLMVSGEENENTDADVMTDYDNHPFVPGTSLAGAFRDYLGLLRTQDSIFGKSGNDSYMSRVFVSDLTFDSETIIVSRDGVGLDENKVTVKGAKYDMEAVDAGATGSFYIEVTNRENDSSASDQIMNILGGLQNGDIRLGKKKTRGYGQVGITSFGTKRYTKANYAKEYVTAFTAKDGITMDGDVDKLIPSASKKDHLSLTLELQGGISIRQYQAKKNAPDFMHIRSAGKPVMPGTSISGAIKARARAIAKMVGVSGHISIPQGAAIDPVDALCQRLFGYVAQKSAQKSLIEFNESVLTGGKPLNISRTAVSRFESSAAKGNLYTETTCIGGKVDLDIAIDKSISNWAIPFILPAILDLQKGYLAVGGQTSIGRGIFQGCEMKLNGETLEQSAIDSYLKRYVDSVSEGAMFFLSDPEEDCKIVEMEAEDKGEVV